MLRHALNNYLAINQPTTIKGSADAAGNPLVAIVGLGAAFDGLTIDATECTVQALDIANFDNGIHLTANATYAAIEGCDIGLYNGMAWRNVANGIEIEGGNNTIGGLTANNANVISANGNAGVLLTGTKATKNVIKGNQIGTDPSGTKVPRDQNNVAAAQLFGISIEAGANANKIGDNVAGAGNVIAGNTTDGVRMIGTGTTGNVLARNAIGTAIDAQTPLPNANNGVTIDQGASSNIIGVANNGNTWGGNVISENGNDGVMIENTGTFGMVTQLNTVQNNYIGLTITDGPLGNKNAGVEINDAVNNTIGATGVSQLGNVISANLIGVYLNNSANTNTVLGNFIGTDVSGLQSDGNGDGVIIDNSSSNTIGGKNVVPPNPNLGDGNLISGNVNTGITLRNGAKTNKIKGNYIGLDVTGQHPVNGIGYKGNGTDGILVSGNVQGNTIGGAFNSGEGNVISENGSGRAPGKPEQGHGIALIGDPNNANLKAQSQLIIGNLIGTDNTGVSALGNFADGIYLGVNAVSNTIGDAANAANQNVICGNGAYGVQADKGSTNNLIDFNLIGKNVNLVVVANTLGWMDDFLLDLGKPSANIWGTNNKTQ
jgi:hypothetical protein